jgi:hypothetical protein
MNDCLVTSRPESHVWALEIHIHTGNFYHLLPYKENLQVLTAVGHRHFMESFRIVPSVARSRDSVVKEAEQWSAQ